MILHLLLSLQVGHEFGGNMRHVQIVSECPELMQMNFQRDSNFTDGDSTVFECEFHYLIYVFILYAF